jgi:hypothetical protein
MVYPPKKSQGYHRAQIRSDLGNQLLGSERSDGFDPMLMIGFPTLVNLCEGDIVWHKFDTSDEEGNFSDKVDFSIA